MYCKSSICIIVFLLVCACNKDYIAKPDQSGLFIKFFGGLDTEIAYSAEQTTDGGFICIGTTRSFGKGSTDIYIIKIDAYGNKQWDKAIGGAGTDEGKEVQLTADGDFIFLCEYMQETGFLDYYLIKTDQEGSIQWTKTFGLPNRHEKAFSLKRTPDDGFLLIGNSVTENDITDMFIVKTKADGSKEWEKNYGLTGLKDGLGAAEVTKTGNLVWCGTEYRDREGNIPGTSDMRVILLQPEGRLLWDKNYGKDNTEVGMDIQLTDGGYIIIGSRFNTTTGETDVYVVKLFADGNVWWSKTYGGNRNEEGTSIYPATDGGYIITGSTESAGEGGKDILLLKIDSQGNEVWSKTFGGRLDDTGSVVKQTMDGGYVVSGTITFENNSMMCLIKTDPKGELVNK